MFKVRKANDRGQANYGWLQANYSFSFASYFDPEHTGFRDLLVLNQDEIAPNAGFDTHPHKNMEIVTYIIEGEIEHVDSSGNKGVIRAGELQRMSAGSGISHSERNPSSTNVTKLLQIWIKPQKMEIAPSYENIKFDEVLKGHKLLVSPQGESHSLKINQDTYFHGLKLASGETKDFTLKKQRHAWLQMIAGKLLVNEKIEVQAGDGLAISEEELLTLKSLTDSEFILIDLA